MTEIKTVENASRALDQDQTAGIFLALLLHITWPDLSTTFWIRRMQIKYNDSKRGISY